MILTNAKILLNINLGDNSKDELLTMLINITKTKVLNYCNLESLPEELEFTVAEMVASLFTSYGVSTEQVSTVAEGVAVGKVKKESLGDYSVEYDVSASSAKKAVTPETVLYDYVSQLNKFRKLRL